jgi:hypothetical protein
MAIIKYEATCKLCGQQAVLKNFTLSTADGLLKFCCEGCLNIYQLLNNCQITR